MLSETKSDQDRPLFMSKDRSKYSRYLKNAHEYLSKAVQHPDYNNRHFTLTTTISKTAKYPIRNPIKIIKGVNYESDVSESINESVDSMLTEIFPSESSKMEQSPYVFCVERINTFERSLRTWAFAPKARVRGKWLLFARERRGESPTYSKCHSR